MGGEVGHEPSGALGAPELHVAVVEELGTRPTEPCPLLIPVLKLLFGEVLRNLLEPLGQPHREEHPVHGEQVLAMFAGADLDHLHLRLVGLQVPDDIQPQLVHGSDESLPELGDSHVCEDFFETGCYRKGVFDSLSGSDSGVKAGRIDRQPDDVAGHRTLGLVLFAVTV